MDKIVARRFFVNASRKIQWENPQRIGKVKFIKFFLKTGEIVSMKRERITRNYLWKYSKPLKYYLLRLKLIANRIKEKELEKLSKKWQIEERLE
jgi:hypothetical protein